MTSIDVKNQYLKELRCWEIFNEPCRQRLKSLLRDEIDRFIKK